jgi:putative DNA primase/helicase
LPVKGDVSDWLDAGGTREELIARAKAAPRSRPNGYVLVRASDIIPRAMDWVWLGHILRGSLELLTGTPGMGKSQLQCQYVACVTTGRAWPDGMNGSPRGNVIMLTAEDCLDQILVPRLRAAKADLDRVHFLKCIRKDNKDRMFLLGEDIEMLARVITDTGEVRLVTIDPITAYMGGKVDSHRATDVRSQLGPLAELAKRMDVAFSAITHPAKNAGQRAIDHFIGSQAFIAAARIGHMAIEEVDEDENGHRQPTGRMLFANPKNNPHPKMSTLAYRITQATGGVDPNTGNDISAACVVWEEVVDLTADQALAAAAPSKKRGPSGAITFLLDILTNGPVLKSVIDKRAGERGFSKDQLNRARRKATSIVGFKEKTFQGCWYWCLAEHLPEGATAEE